MTSKEVQQYALTGGLLLGAYLFGKKILESLNIIETKEEKDSDSNITAELAAPGGPKATKTKGEWQIIAENIYEAWRYSSISDNKNIAFMQIMRVKNNNDFALLYSTYGKRQLYFFGLPAGGKKNLLQASGSEFSKSTKQKINNSYANKNIKYRIP